MHRTGESAGAGKNLWKKQLCIIAAVLISFCFLTPGESHADQTLPVTGMPVSDSYANGPYYRNLINAAYNSIGASPADRLINIAQSQVGYTGSTGQSDLSGNGNGGNYNEYNRYRNCFGQSWCAAFVSWCVEAAGIPASVIPVSNRAGHWTGVSVGEFHRAWSDDFTVPRTDYTPQRGDLCLYMPYHEDTSCLKHYNAWSPTAHVGIVKEVTRNSDNSYTITTIERDDYTVCNKTLKTTDHRGSYGTCTHLNTGSQYAHTIQGFFHPDWSKASVWTESDMDLFGPMDLGDDFYAVILNTGYWKPISQKAGSDRIFLETEDGSSRQIWRFIRQSNGSYVISSCYDGKVLEMHNGIRENGTQLSAHDGDWGGAYQRWYLLPYGDGYIIKSQHYPDENWVMDNNGNSGQDGNSIQIYRRNNTAGQIWSIYKGDDVQLKGPALTAVPGTSGTATRFEWNRTYGASFYNVRIFKDTLWEGEDHSVWNVTSTECSVVLPAGNYYAYVDAVNYHKYQAGNVISFSVRNDLYDTRDKSLTMYLPSGLTKVNSEAFRGVAARYFVLPSGVHTIEASSFPANTTVFLYGQNIQSADVNLFGGAGTIVEMNGNGSASLAARFSGTQVQYVRRDGTRIDP